MVFKNPCVHFYAYKGRVGGNWNQCGIFFKEEFKKGKETISWFVKELEYELVLCKVINSIKTKKLKYGKLE